jgi:uncharacterized repeat protein (TIGR03806 family)
MPRTASGALPRLLSETGAFKDVRALRAAGSLIAYDLIAPFWSDGAAKSRWIALPSPGQIRFAPAGEWAFPNGTVFVKHFEFPIDETRPAMTRRLETRVLVRDDSGGVYGVTYKWRRDNSDAELLTNSLMESITINTATGLRTQQWYYPSSADCLLCHTTNAGGVLGLKTRQLNHEFFYPASRITDNQLRTWNHLGLFDTRLDEADIPRLVKLIDPKDQSAPLEERARSYLDVNCAQCHRPGGAVSYFDARYDTPLSRQNLIDGPVVIDQGIDNARVIAANDPWRSIGFLRINTLDATKMPPLAHETLDPAGIDLLKNWIRSLPGTPVVEPPTLSPQGGEFAKHVIVTIQHPDPAAEIRYTLDGSAPGRRSALYQKPLDLSDSTTVRARAYREGFTRSITVQQTFIVGE